MLRAHPLPSLLAAGGLLLLSGAAVAQTSRFDWRPRPKDLGTIQLPSTLGEGWIGLGEGARYRPVPSYSTDPTYEVLLGPPLSGSDIHPERFLVQFPADFRQRSMEQRAVVLAFHSYSRSEKQVFTETDLPEICAQKGWMLVAPYGLNDTNLANVDSQRSALAVLSFLRTKIPYDKDRIYAVGFSMGALNALSFAMRHLDPLDARIAGVVFHSGNLDLVKVYENAPIEVQSLMVDADHFRASPAEDLFAYERVSPARLLPDGFVYWDRAPVTNLLHVPIYIHVNLADPDANLVSEVTELSDYLTARGGIVTESLVLDPINGHSWQTLALGPAIEYVGSNVLGADPESVELFADRATRWHFVEVRAKDDGVHAHFRVALRPPELGTLNSFSISDSRGLRTVAFDLARMGLDPGQPLTFQCSARDPVPVNYILKGYPRAPSRVTWLGTGRYRAVYDPATKELWVTVIPQSRPALVDIVP